MPDSCLHSFLFGSEHALFLRETHNQSCAAGYQQMEYSEFLGLFFSAKSLKFRSGCIALSKRLLCYTVFSRALVPVLGAVPDLFVCVLAFFWTSISKFALIQAKYEKCCFTGR